MTTKKAKYELTVKEAMLVLQIINCHKKVELGKPAEEQNLDDIQLFDELISTILSGDNNGETITYKISIQKAFGVWLTVDTYKKYLTEMKAIDDIELIEHILIKLCCKR